MSDFSQIVDAATNGDFIAVKAIFNHLTPTNNQLCLWALVNEADKPEKRIIAIFGTGRQLPENVNISKHIATVQSPPLVWHIFEIDSSID